MKESSEIYEEYVVLYFTFHKLVFEFNINIKTAIEFIYYTVDDSSLIRQS